MLPGIPSHSRLDRDEAATAYVPRVRPAPAVEAVSQPGAAVEPGTGFRGAAHARPEPPPRAPRTVLPWLVFAVLAVLVVGGTTLWSSTLHIPTTPVESLIGPSATAIPTTVPAAPPAPAPAPAPAPTTRASAPTHRAPAHVPRAVIRTTVPPVPPPVVAPPLPAAPVLPTVAPTTVAARPSGTKHSKHT